MQEAHGSIDQQINLKEITNPKAAELFPSSEGWGQVDGRGEEPIEIDGKLKYPGILLCQNIPEGKNPTDYLQELSQKYLLQKYPVRLFYQEGSAYDEDKKTGEKIFATFYSDTEGEGVIPSERLVDAGEEVEQRVPTPKDFRETKPIEGFTEDVNSENGRKYQIQVINSINSSLAVPGEGREMEEGDGGLFAIQVIDLSESQDFWNNPDNKGKHNQDAEMMKDLPEDILIAAFNYIEEVFGKFSSKRVGIQNALVGTAGHFHVLVQVPQLAGIKNTTKEDIENPPSLAQLPEGTTTPSLIDNMRSFPIKKTTENTPAMNFRNFIRSRFDAVK
jgi:hypothetical protein